MGKLDAPSDGLLYKDNVEHNVVVVSTALRVLSSLFQAFSKLGHNAKNDERKNRGEARRGNGAGRSFALRTKPFFCAAPQLTERLEEAKFSQAYFLRVFPITR